MSHARTTVVRPADPALGSVLRLALGFALVKLALHVGANLWQAHIGWGYFRDEFYYIACGRHLAWGYVDHGPIVALQARLADTLFGHSLAGLRLPAALAGATRVALTGLLAYALGGRRSAQSLAMLGVLVVPQYLGIDSFLSMNSFESPLWMTCLLALLGLERRLGLAPVIAGGSAPENPTANAPALGPWLLFGLSAGIGLLNKPSMTFLLLALGVALLSTRTSRVLLLRREALAGIALLLAVAAPNVLWQIHNHWPTLEFLRNVRLEGKNLALPPLAFLRQQIQTLHPLTVFLWLPGLVFLLRRAPWRWLGLTYLLFLAGMMALHAKDYYVTPIYPILFAAGGVAWEHRRWLPFGQLSAASGPRRADRIVAFPLYQATLAITGLLISPMAIPLCSPAAWLRYTRALHLYSTGGNTETMSSGVLPQFYADRFGWQEQADEVARIVASLSPEDRAHLVIVCDNYGEAGALQFLVPSLPRVVSGHNTYWLWGPGDADADVVISISGGPPEDTLRYYTDVQTVGTMNLSQFQMPHERRKHIYLARHRRQTIVALWPKLKEYI